MTKPELKNNRDNERIFKVEKLYYIKKSLFGSTLIVLLIIFGTLSPAAPASAWNFTVPAVEVRPNSGHFKFPESQFADGQARHFVYKHSPSLWIRFFVLRSSDGLVRAAFDACDVCWRHKKGYVQQGDQMICMNCGLRFPSVKINEVKGGCNPAPLPRLIRNGQLIIALNDVLAGQGFFQ
jgi:uncharacterized membrane protein